MSSYIIITSARLTMPDGPSLVAAVRAALDPAAGVAQRTQTEYVVKVPAPLTELQIAAAQIAIDSAPATSPQLTAQALIDQMSTVEKAKILTSLDQFNLIRSKLVPPLPAVTVEEMIAAVRTKAGQL